MSGIDPITFAVIKSGLDTIVDDMAYAVMRTARSSIVRDVLDYSVTICDAKGRILNHDVSIAMLYGMPAEVFEKTVAHELMHAWIFLDREPEHTLDLEEGTCNLTSYYFLQERQDPLAGFLREAMFKSSNPVYGEGLRRAIRYVQANKFTGLVKMLRTHKDFPTGY